MSNDYQSGAAQSAQMSHAELIEALRSHGQMNIDSEKDKPEFGLLTVEGRIMKTYADDLDAAHKREIDEAERRANHAAMKNVSETLAKVGPLYDAESIGNAAKLREVVGDLLYMAERYVKKTPATESAIFDAKTKKEIRTVNYYDVIAKAQAALAAPPRNCDVARDWMRDLYAHFQPPASIKREMPPEWVDSVMAFCRWLVAPATEKEGGAK